MTSTSIKKCEVMLNKEKKVHVSTCPVHDVLDRHGHKQQMIVSTEKKKT